jgi:hypothetical protein
MNGQVQISAKDATRNRKRLAVLSTILLTIIVALWPLPAKADGGPIVDPMLFAKLKEGQQVAVVTLNDTTTASVDLFISILDQTDESHEVVFFVPLGVKASLYFVQEQDSFAFNDSLTRQLDMALFEDYRQDRQFRQYLFAGALMTNGVWLVPLWLPFLLTGCEAGPAATPVSTFRTDSSEVSVYGLDESTDLEALISTTGLDPAVAGTLSRLKGQQIAVVNLRTKPHGTATGSVGADSSGGEPGLHLSWQTSLIPSGFGATYAYPLGTGAAWAHPIEMTRVYVVAPMELDFTVRYPRLGVNRSGFVREQGYYEPRIASSSQVPAYAVDKATERVSYQSVHIWRVTYTNSNAAEDILITVRESSGVNLGASLRQEGPQLAFIIGLIMALLFWILAWWLLLPRLLGRDRRIRGLWRFGLTYIGWNALLFLPGAILYFFFSLGAQVIAITFLVILFGGTSVIIFAWRHMDQLAKQGIGTGGGIRAFIIVTLVSNGAYFLFVLGYARLVSAI